MGVQFVLGPAGSGKTEYMLKTIIEESMLHDDMSYLYIVPEQFSMEAQRDIVTRHPRHGSMNIDAIGLNRLAYRVFDELSINPGQVLEDFGKSMLVKRILMENQDDLLMYGNYMDKMGFVDEMKSMMSELFQYAVDREEIDMAMEQMDSESSTYRKLHDIRLIYEKFEEHNANDQYIVAEQLSQLLAANVEKSQFISKSHMYFDGFTGFTPVQMKLVTQLMSHAASVTFAFDIDPDRIGLAKPKEYELFRLTKETIAAICKAAADVHVDILDNVVMCGQGEIPYRFRNDPCLAAFERNIFRYPHQKINGAADSIKLVRTDRARDEALYVASQIRKLVREKGYRYKDIAVVAGDLHDVAGYYRQAMDEYRIPVFIDENTALRGDPCSDTVRAFLAVMSDNFSFNSVFRLLKSGMTEVAYMDVERMENYALKRNLRGYKSWLKEITDKNNSDYAQEMDSIRRQIVSIFGEDCIDVYKPSSPNSKDTVTNYTKELYNFLDELHVCEKLEERRKRLYEEKLFDEGDAYGQIFDKIVALFDKVVTILGDEKMTVKEYAGVLEAGISDMEIGIVPPTIDRVVVGDMTRSRLNHVKALFFTGVNEGIIPKPAKKGKILSNGDRQNLEKCGVTLAPSDKTNAYIEQFYIYTSLTKPSDNLYIVFRKMGEDMNAVGPSYLVDRIRNIFPDIEIEDYDLDSQIPETVNGALRYLVSRYDEVGSDGTLQAVKRLIEQQGGNTEYATWLGAMQSGYDYVNETKTLSPETVKLLYGTELTESVSKLEKYAECQFKYFLQYGLGLMDRETYQLNAANVGIILHSSMQKMFEYIKTKCGNNWADITETELADRAVEFVDASADDEAAEYFEDSSRAAYVKKFLEDIAGSGELVVHLLTGEELHTVVVVLAQLFHELIVLQVLAAQMQHQNGGSIGVAHQRSQQFAGLCMVVAGLAAAEGMGEGVQTLDGTGDQILIVGYHLLGDIVHAAHSGDDPDLVADGGAAVLAAEAHKGLRLDLGQGSQIRGGVVAVLHLAGQVGVHVMGVHPGTGGGVCGGVTDGEAVLDDVLAVLNGLDCHLVTLRDILQCGDGKAVHLHQRALGNGVQGNDHIVDGADMNCLRHSCSPYRIAQKGCCPKQQPFVVRVG